MKKIDLKLIILSLLPAIYVLTILHLYGLRIIDDGYYYLQIAFNIANNNIVSFDGINVTNGFHPLWQFFIVPFYWIVLSKTTAAYVITIVQLLLFILSGVVLVSIIHKDSLSHIPSYIGGVLWLCNPYCINKGAWTGMETALLILLYALSLKLFLRWFQYNKNAFTVGILFALTISARLDSVFYIFAMFIVVILYKRPSINEMVKLFIPSIIFVSIYCAINGFIFKHWMPISGYVRSHNRMIEWENLFVQGDGKIFQSLAETGYAILTFNGTISFLISTLLIVGISAIIIVVYQKSDIYDRILFVLTSMLSLMLASYYYLFFGNILELYTYYWFPAIFLAIISSCLIIKKLIPSRQQVFVFIFSILLLGIFSFEYIPQLIKTFPNGKYPSIVEYINTNLPDSSIVGSWSSGYLGYYCTKPVINLDNLVNNFELAAYRENDSLKVYLVKKRITHLANPDFMNGPREWIQQFTSSILLYEDSIFTPQKTTFITISKNMKTLEMNTGSYQKVYLYKFK